MKAQKNRLPLIVAVSAVLWVVIIILSVILVDAADESMTQERIDENKASMQQAAANVQKEIDAKSAYIAEAAASLSGKEKNFDKLLEKN